MARHTNSSLLRLFVVDSGHSAGYASNLSISNRVLYSYSMPIAMFDADNCFRILHDPETTTTTKVHINECIWMFRRLRSGTIRFVPSLNATEEETISYFQARLDRIEQRWNRSHSVNTLCEYFYLYDAAAWVAESLRLAPKMRLAYMLENRR